VIAITSWVGVFIVVTGVLNILIVREERRQRPLNLAGRDALGQQAMRSRPGLVGFRFWADDGQPGSYRLTGRISTDQRA